MPPDAPDKKNLSPNDRLIRPIEQKPGLNEVSKMLDRTHKAIADTFGIPERLLRTKERRHAGTS